MWLRAVLERPTPYHTPHSTQVAGYAAIHGGDDRHIGNIFLGGDAALAYGPTSRGRHQRRLRNGRVQRSPGFDGGVPRTYRRPDREATMSASWT